MTLRMLSATIVILLLLTALAAIASSNADKPFLVDASAAPAVTRADYQACATIRTPPLKPPAGIRLYPRNSEIV